ncbi:MAG: aminotransferase class V-fold PLP-dependent enzyme [Candidatus Delongbacteria bacterium]
MTPPEDPGIRFNLAPGPSRLLPLMPRAAANFLESGLGGLHHRSPELGALTGRLVERLRACLELPADFQVWFVSSASYAMELCVRNLVRDSCSALVAGAFGGRFAQVAELTGRRVCVSRSAPGTAPTAPPEDPAWRSGEAWLLCHNETATGTALPLERWPAPRPGDPLRLVDCVSSAGAQRLPWQQGDLWFFSVQKAFGCPPGLAVILAGPRAVARARELEAEGRDTGAWFSFARLADNAARRQSPCTPNSLGLHLLSEAAAWLTERGPAAVEAHVRDLRAACLDWLESHPALVAAVTDPAARSLTVTALRRRDGGELTTLQQALRAQGIVVGGGYGDWRGTSLRLAHFPVHEREELATVCAAIDRIVLA